MVNGGSGLAGLRVGFGMESGRLQAGHELKLGGVMIDHPAGLTGAGDADIVSRAVLDAVLSASGMPDLRTVFPDDEDELKGVETLVMLSQAVSSLRRQRLEAILNLNVRILCPPRLNLTEDRKRIESALAAALETTPGQVSVGFGETAELAPAEANAVVAFAHCLCLLKTELPRKGQVQARQGEMFMPAPAGDDDDAGLPERARKFEQALKSKLPPLPPAPPPAEGALLIVYTDGASRGNPGPSASGWVVLDEQGRLVMEGGSALGVHTNNEAEYMAVREVLEQIEQQLGGGFRLELRLDSELVVRQLRGEWKIKDERLKKLALLAMNQLGFFLSAELNHVPRQHNQRADALANKALGAK